MNMTEQSSGMMQQYIEEGVISVQSTNEFFQKCDLVVNKAFENAIIDASDARKRVANFCEQVDKAVSKFDQFAYQLIETISTATPDEITRYQTVKEISTDLIKHHVFAAQQYFAVRSLATKDEKERWQGVIDLAFDQRIKAINLLEKSMEVVHKHESHKLEVFVKVHNQKLKQEAQAFDQMMKTKQFESEEVQKEHQRRLQEYESNQKWHIEGEKLKQEEKKIDYENARAEVQQKLMHEQEMERISSNERIGYANATAQIASSKSSCTIF